LTDLDKEILAVEDDITSHMLFIDARTALFGQIFDRRAVLHGLMLSSKKNLIVMREAPVTDLETYKTVVNNIRVFIKEATTREVEMAKLKTEIEKAKQNLVELQREVKQLKSIKEGFGKVIHGKFKRAD
jgi:5-bromo-4-chloroindolyl phosphate hydrolysis protein